MNNHAASWSTDSRKCSLTRCAVILACVVGCSFVLAMPISFFQHGLRGLLELSAAALLCFVPALAALVVSYRYLTSPQAMLGILLAMAFRALPPLLICMMLALKGSGADYFHFVCTLLFFYLGTLAAETCLSVRLVRANPALATTQNPTAK